MCKILLENEKEIENYCQKNKLYFEKLKYSPKCYNNEHIFFQYVDYDDNNGLGLLDETPAPVTLMIYKRDNGLEFIQTEHTAKYLGLNG
jgi:hypothetical protein